MCNINKNLDIKLDLIKDIFEQMKVKTSQTEYIMSITEKLGHISGTSGTDEEVSLAKVETLGDVVMFRETTNQHIIKLYEKYMRF